MSNDQESRFPVADYGPFSKQGETNRFYWYRKDWVSNGQQFYLFGVEEKKSGGLFVREKSTNEQYITETLTKVLEDYEGYFENLPEGIKAINQLT